MTHETNRITTAEYRDEVNFAMTERHLQEKCERALRGLGAFAYHPYDSRKSSPGYPDLTVVAKDGRLAFFELKTEKGVLSKHQERWLDRLAAVKGATVAVIRPSEFDWLMQWARGEL